MSYLIKRGLCHYGNQQEIRIECHVFLYPNPGNKVWMYCLCVKTVLRFRVSDRVNPQLPLDNFYFGQSRFSLHPLTGWQKDSKVWQNEKNTWISIQHGQVNAYIQEENSVMLHLLQHIRTDRFASPVTLFLVTYSLKWMFHFHSNFLLLRWHGSLSNLKDTSVLFCALRECELILWFP